MPRARHDDVVCARRPRGRASCAKEAQRGIAALACRGGLPERLGLALRALTQPRYSSRHGAQIARSGARVGRGSRVCHGVLLRAQRMRTPARSASGTRSTICMRCLVCAAASTPQPRQSAPTDEALVDPEQRSRMGPRGHGSDAALCRGVLHDAHDRRRSPMSDEAPAGMFRSPMITSGSEALVVRPDPGVDPRHSLANDGGSARGRDRRQVKDPDDDGPIEGGPASSFR